MLHKVVNGYTVMAHEFNFRDSLYWILGCRRIGPGSYEYIVAGMESFDNDRHWVTNGYYPTNIGDAYKRYAQMKGV